MSTPEIIATVIVLAILAFAFRVMHTHSIRFKEAQKSIILQSLVCGHDITSDPPSDFRLQLMQRGSHWYIHATGGGAEYEKVLNSVTEEKAVSEFNWIAERAAGIIKRGWQERQIAAVAIDQQGNIVQRRSAND